MNVPLRSSQARHANFTTMESESAGWSESVTQWDCDSEGHGGPLGPGPQPEAGLAWRGKTRVGARSKQRSLFSNRLLIQKTAWAANNQC